MNGTMRDIPGGLSFSSGAVLPDSSPLRSGYNTPNGSSNVNSSPSAHSFNFTPTYGRRIYPILGPPTITQLRSSPGAMAENAADESYYNRENSSFVCAMDTLQQQMFSSNISNKVLNEFNDRYDQVRKENINNLELLNSTTSNEELNRRASGRFGKDHKNRFNRMESISLHYAAKRAEQNEKQRLTQKTKPAAHRKLIAVNNTANKENASLADKRLQYQLLESATKRMKTLDGTFKEIDSSPTKTLEEKKELKDYYKIKTESIYQASFPEVSPMKPPNLERKEKTIPTYLLPTKASLRKSTSIDQLSPSRSNTSIKSEFNKPHGICSKFSNNNKPKDIARSTFIPSLKHSPSKLFSKQEPNEGAFKSQVKKSPSLSPSKLASSKISPSKASSNLNAILKGVHPKLNPSSLPTTNSAISRSKTARDFGSSTISARSSIPTSISSRSFSSKPFPVSSSIPRLVSLANSEKIVKKKGWQY